MILPTIAPIAVLSSLGELVADVGPAEVELRVAEVWVDEPLGNSVADSEEVTDGVGDVIVDDVGGKVEEVGGFVKLGSVGDAGGKFVVLGGVGPP